MKKSAFLSDVIFTFLATFLFFLCFFRYRGTPFWGSFFVASVFAAIFAAVAGAFLQRKRNAFFLKKSDAEQKEKLLLHLALLSDDKKTEFFKNALSKKDDVKRFGNLKIFTKTEFCFLHFTFSPTTADDVAKFSRLKTGKRRILFCADADQKAKDLCLRLNIEVRTGAQVYALLKELDALPQTYLGEDVPKRKRRLKLWLAKSNGKHFLIGGAVLLITSLYTPFPYYYLIFGSAMLIAAAFIRIFGYE